MFSGTEKETIGAVDFDMAKYAEGGFVCEKLEMNENTEIEIGVRVNQLTVNTKKSDSTPQKR